MIVLTSRYTAKFDKVDMERIVVNVSDLPDPEVLSLACLF